MSGWNLVNPLWWLSRPQQAVFGGAKEGSQAFEKDLGSFNRAMPNNPEALNAVMAAATSLPQALSGVVRAFNPWAQETKGKNLVNGLFDNQEWNEPVGNTLDVLADPLAALGNTGAQTAGTMARTAKSLRDMSKYNPSAAEAIKKDFGWNRFLADIPTGEAIHEFDNNMNRVSSFPYPAIIKDTPLFSAETATKKYYPGESEFINGFALGDKYAYIKNKPDKVAQKETLLHEIIHLLSDGVWGFVPSQVPAMAEKFRNTIRGNKFMEDAYLGGSESSLASELLARVGSRRPQNVKDPMLRDIVDTAHSHVRSIPEYMKEADPLTGMWAALSAMGLSGRNGE